MNKSKFTVDHSNSSELKKVAVIFLMVLIIMFGVILIAKLFIKINDTEAKIINLNNYSSYYINRENIDFSPQLMGKEFKKTESKNINLGLNNKNIWLKIDFSSFESDFGSRVFFLNRQSFVELKGYYFSEEGVYKEINFLTEETINPHFHFPADFNVDKELYVKINSIMSSFTPYLSEENDFITYQTRLLSFLVFSLSIIFTMLIINVVLSIFLKDKYFLLHGLFLFFALIFEFTSLGIFKVLFKTHDYFYYFWAFLSIASMLIFVYYYLGLKNKFKFLSKAFYLLLFLSLIGAFMSRKNFIPSLYYIIMFLAFSLPVVFLIIIIRLILNEENLSFYFLLGTLMLTLTMPLIVLSNSGFIKDSLFNQYIFTYALAIEALFFTLGIMDQMRLLRKSEDFFYSIAITDKLTNIHNRNYFDMNINKYIDNASRYKEDLSMIIFDIDHFKRVNDDYGHDTGDKVLIELSALVNKNIRKSDIFIRWGGEEFLLILPKTNLEGAASLAENLRRKVEEHNFEKINKLTISLGVAALKEDETVEDFFRRIDAVLYIAKSNGRNRVEVNFDSYKIKASNRDDIQQFNLRWMEYFCCGNQKIDSQHQKLLDDLNKLIVLYHQEDNEIFLEQLNVILKNTENHFTEEELILVDKDYTELKQHKEKHKNIIKNLKNSINDYKNKNKLASELIQEIISFVIMGHLLSDDFRFFNLFD